jgi:uncharacterized protein YegP (UPF0339 family)
VVEIKKEKERFYFVVRSGQGSELLQSVEFPSRKDLEKCLRDVCAKLGNPSCFERRTDHNGKFRFSLKTAEGKILGQSAAYRSEAGMENGIKNTRIALTRAALP